MSLEIRKCDRQFDTLEALKDVVAKEEWLSSETQEYNPEGRVFVWERDLSCIWVVLHFLRQLGLSLLIIPLFSQNFRERWGAVFKGKEITWVLCTGKFQGGKSKGLLQGHALGNDLLNLISKPIAPPPSALPFSSSAGTGHGFTTGSSDLSSLFSGRGTSAFSADDDEDEEETGGVSQANRSVLFPPRSFTSGAPISKPSAMTGSLLSLFNRSGSTSSTTSSTAPPTASSAPKPWPTLSSLFSITPQAPAPTPSSGESDGKGDDDARPTTASATTKATLSLVSPSATSSASLHPPSFQPPQLSASTPPMPPPPMKQPSSSILTRLNSVVASLVSNEPEGELPKKEKIGSGSSAKPTSAPTSSSSSESASSAAASTSSSSSSATAPSAPAATLQSMLTRLKSSSGSLSHLKLPQSTPQTFSFLIDKTTPLTHDAMLALPLSSIDLAASDTYFRSITEKDIESLRYKAKRIMSPDCPATVDKLTIADLFRLDAKQFHQFAPSLPPFALLFLNEREFKQLDMARLTQAQVDGCLSRTSQWTFTQIVTAFPRLTDKSLLKLSEEQLRAVLHKPTDPAAPDPAADVRTYIISNWKVDK